MSRKVWFRNIGPGALVAAAFVGPGTVTLCTLAGVGFGFDLLWAMALSIFATIALQEMAARLGLVTQRGLAEVVRAEISHPVVNRFMMFLILAAIVVGNAAYQAGNISGGSLGLEALAGQHHLTVFSQPVNLITLIMGAIAFLILYFGNYKALEKVFITLVVLMSFSFVLAAIATKPSLGLIAKGLLQPKSPDGSFLTIVGLIGTTVVPYNLFLHASLVKEKWSGLKDLKAVRIDTTISIILGGVVSMAIIISASAANLTDVHSAADLAEALAPLYGEYAKSFLAVGLFAAGITSAITAPLAAAFVAKGCLGFNGNMHSRAFRLVWMFVLLFGVLLSSFGVKPIEIIQFAQIANGFLLPLIAGVLLWVVNKKTVLGKFVNTKTQNIIGMAILLLSLSLGLKAILKALGAI
ncbi:MAG: Nramp family divalent metal transporter [Planctomycetes bacterium]|jgi:Mn2+/Fe2+ NRAMP family transporter|nr:Nramp family divalent metal transporter [Planctomycetota bacterium]MBT4027861.1 Nramp family divalent metal transporter [Planctomycetota bacterium]MBT4559344.1 Nramp family divalent metal transporter [Planctomycetota bacterium]MBT5102172.1 Nramp family divalent metal transporter [Planctomycetota bacterium]MBT5120053.1 Nramp family divalent metal transporter [Planctomycetota bacterium]